MDAVDRLLALEELKALKARYFRFVDTKDWAGLAAVFATDAVFDRRGGRSLCDPLTVECHPALPTEALCVGRDAIVGMIRAAVEPYRTAHHGHTPEIDLIDATSANGIWAMQDKIRDAQGQLVLRGTGHYHDTYVRSAAGWAIRTTRISRLTLDLPGGET